MAESCVCHKMEPGELRYGEIAGFCGEYLRQMAEMRSQMSKELQAKSDRIAVQKKGYGAKEFAIQSRSEGEDGDAGRGQTGFGSSTATRGRSRATVPRADGGAGYRAAAGADWKCIQRVRLERRIA